MLELPTLGGAKLTDLSPCAKHLFKALAVLPFEYKPTIGWTRDFYMECIVKLEEEQEEWPDVLKQLRECKAFIPFSDLPKLTTELLLVERSILDGMEDAEKDEYILLAFRYALRMKADYDEMDEYPYGIHSGMYMMFLLATIGMSYVIHHFIDMDDEEIEEYRTKAEHYLGFLTCEELLALVSICNNWAQMIAMNNFDDILPACYDEVFNLLDYTQDKFGLDAIMEAKKTYIVVAAIMLQNAGHGEIVIEFALNYYEELKAYAMSHPKSEMAWDCFASAGTNVVTAYMHQIKFPKAKEYAEEMIKLSKLYMVKDNEGLLKLELVSTQLLEMFKTEI